MITNIRLRTFDVDYIDLFWETAPGYDGLDYTFRVVRSEAQHGPFTPITGSFSDRYHLRDSTAYQMTRRRWYYKIETTHRTSGAVALWPEGPGVSQEVKLDLEGLEMARQYSLRLQQHTGRECWVFPCRTFGPRCPSCVDSLTKQRMHMVCLTCYGTGFAGGYLAPVRTYANVVVVQADVVVAETHKDRRRIATCNLGNQPEVKIKDLVVEAENIRWEVVKVSDVRKARALIRQELTLMEYDPGNVVYRLQLGEVVSDLVVAPGQRMTLPASPENALPRRLT